MTARGGFLAIYPAILLSGDDFPDLSLAAVGAWLRIRATSEMTGEPVSSRTAERLGVTADVLAELIAAGLLTEAEGRLEAIGMPEAPGKPSDSPEAIRGRVAKFREREKEAKRESNPLHSTPLQSNAVTRYGALPRDTSDDDAPGPHQAEINGVLVRWEVRA